MPKHKLMQGLTLIEVMIAVLVLSIIAVYSISLLKGQARAEAENKAIVEIKGWLEASQAYFADNNAWPGCNNLNCDEPIKDKNGNVVPFYEVLIQQGYMPAYPAPYVNGQAPWPSGTYSGFPDQNSTNNPKGLYFTVQVTAPDTTMAQHIASQLPYGSNAGAVVSASIPMPGADKGYLAGAGVVRLRYKDNLNYDKCYNGNCSSDCNGCCNISSNGTGCSVNAKERTINLPVCAPGFEGHYILAPLVYATGFIVGVDFSCYGHVRNKIIGHSPPECNSSYSFPGTVVRLGFSDLYSDKNGRYVYAADTIETSFWATGSVAPHYIAYYLTYCIPNGTWNVPSGAVPPSNDSQCHNNWTGSGGYNRYAKPC